MRKFAYKVFTRDLPKVTQIFNHTEAFFKSEVTGIIPISNTEYALIIVDTEGSYSYITNKWKEHIIEETI